MADIPRAPVAVNRRRDPPALPFAGQGRNLVVGLVHALPIGAAALGFAPLTQWQPADTARGTPRCLLDAPPPAAPFVPPPQFSAPRASWVAQSTAAGTPKTLYGDASTPVGGHLDRIVQPKLRAGEWVPAETSRGTPKVLYGDATQPVGAQRTESVTHRSAGEWVPANSAAGMPLALLAPVIFPLPPGAQWVTSAPHRVPWLTSEATRGTPKTLYGDAALPVGAQRTAGVTHRSAGEWLPANSATGTPFTLFAPVVVALPPGVQWLASAPRPASWLPADGTRGTPKPLTADAALPVGRASLEPTAVSRWLPQSTSAGAPAVLVTPPGNPLPPGAQQWLPAPALATIEPSESRGTPKALYGDGGLPVGRQWTASIPMQLAPGGWQPANTSASSWVVAAPVAPVVTFVDGNGRVWHIDARGRAWHVDARGRVWHVG